MTKFSPNIYCYSEFDNSDKIPDRIYKLLKECLDKGCLPYLSEKDNRARCCNSSAINSRVIQSVQAIELDLFGSLIKEHTYGKWIYGAEAKYLGLELKEDSKNPRISEPACYSYINGRFNVRYNNTTQTLNEGLKCNNQAVYFLEQFTPESINRAFTTKNIRRALSDTYDDKNLLAYSNALISSLTDYGKNPSFISHLQDAAKNIAKNLSIDNPNQEVTGQVREFVKGYKADEKKVFLTVARYYTKQNGGDMDIKPFEASLEDFKNILERHDAKYVTDILYNAKVFADRLSFYDFSYEQVYTEQEKQKKTGYAENYRRPVNFKKAPYLQSVINEKERERMLRSRTSVKKGYETARNGR